MRYKVTALFFILICIVSCKEETANYTEVTEFPNIKEVEISVLNTDSVILSPEKIFIFNDQIWVLQTKNNKLFDVFEISTGKHLYSTGSRGQGPNEFVSPIASTLVVEGDVFTLLDYNVLKTVSVDSVGNLEVISSKNTFDLVPINGFVKLQEGVFCAFADCATGTEGDYEYRLIDVSTDNELKFSEYPEFLTNKKFEGDQRCQIFNKYPVSNPQIGKFASFYSFFKFFRIYNFDGEMEKQVFVKIPPFTSDDVDNWQKREIYYRPPFGTRDYIYSYCGSNEIQVWDWDGNPVFQYILERPFYTFTVSEEHKKLFLVSKIEDDLDKIFVFDLEH